MFRSIAVACCVAATLTLVAPATARAQSNVAVIDVQRVVTESDPGKEALGKLQQLQEQKIAEGKKLQEELDALREQFNKQRFTLSQDKLEELQKQIEDKTIALKRFQDDAQRELDDARKRYLGQLEQQIMPIIDQVGKEKKLDLIFNKFQSGLVFAADAVDITDEIIQRFNTSK